MINIKKQKNVRFSGRFFDDNYLSLFSDLTSASSFPIALIDNTFKIMQIKGNAETISRYQSAFRLPEACHR